MFDLDGTPIDSKRDLAESVNATLREIGRPELPADRVASYVGSGAPVLIRRALGGTPAAEEFESALKYFLAHYEEHKLDYTREYPGVREALELLRGVPMAVLTNKPVTISVGILEGLRLAGFFRAIYGGNSFATKKPDPLGANTALSELRIAAKETAMVGDSELDVQTARNAGMISPSSISDSARTIAKRILRISTWTVWKSCCPSCKRGLPRTNPCADAASKAIPMKGLRTLNVQGRLGAC